MKNKGKQCAKRAVSDTAGLVGFAIGLLNSVPHLPDGQKKYFEEFNLQKKFKINSVNASFSLPE